MSKRRPPDDRPDDILERLNRHLELLGLTRTLELLDEHLSWALKDKPPPTVLLERILGEEAARRRERRVERRIATSGLRERKNLEAFDWAFQPGIDKSLILELARLDWVRRIEDLVITGKSGTGKSHILQAIGLKACEQQMSVRYTRCVDLLDDLYAGLADGTYPTRLKRWSAPDLLIIDDVGLGQVRKREDEPTAAHSLYNLLDRRHAKASTAVTSNIKLSGWGRYLGDTALAAAVLDRLAMHAIRIDIDGPSFRQQVARDRAQQRGSKIPQDDES
jgi:DNA replication protein DnaC